MRIPIYQVDAFTDNIFGGNPAAVCLPEKPLSPEMMQHIATENNLAETAFIYPAGKDYSIRWFTPKVEVDLCGHATLASAHVLFDHRDYDRDTIRFSSRSGILTVRKENELLVLNFPVDPAAKAGVPEGVAEALGIAPEECYQGKTDYMLVYKSQHQVEKIAPDFGLLLKTPARGIIVTAPGKECDFVSRFFGPQVGINEDPVTGSAHTTLTPYWSKRLGKTSLSAIQLSERKGYLWCKDLGERIEIAGKAVTYFIGEIV